MRSPLLVNFCIRLLRQSTTMISSRGVHVTPHEDRPSSELQSSTCHNTHTTPIQHPHTTPTHHPHTTSTQHPHNTPATPTQHPHNTHTLYLLATTPTQHPHALFTCHTTHTTPTLSIQVPQHQHSKSGATTLHSSATTPTLQFGCHRFSLTKPSPRQTDRGTDRQR